MNLTVLITLIAAVMRWCAFSLLALVFLYSCYVVISVKQQISQTLEGPNSWLWPLEGPGLGLERPGLAFSLEALKVNNTAYYIPQT